MKNLEQQQRQQQQQFSMFSRKSSRGLNTLVVLQTHFSPLSLDRRKDVFELSEQEQRPDQRQILEGRTPPITQPTNVQIPASATTKSGLGGVVTTRLPPVNGQGI